ncbi:hemolysin family protein [Barnesiella intestinihominis]|uniref:hemolysin family protein n=1 Tax=Barnesiella intestinihominis TaxID=487174 RepID=UPI003A86FAF9
MEIIIIVLLILCNGVLSMSEIALVSARKVKLENSAKKGSKAALSALKLSQDPDRFLSTVQIGITLIGILTGLYSGEALAQSFAKLLAKSSLLAPYAVGLAQAIIVIIVTYLTLIIGELVPKRIGMIASERVAKIVSRPMSWLSYIASPFVWILTKSTAGVCRFLGLSSQKEGITEDEIKAIVREGTEGGCVQEVEQDIVERVFNLGDRNISSIMTHRSDLICLDVQDDNTTLKSKITNDLHAVYPLCEDSLDNIIGIVSLKDLFGKIDDKNFDIRAVASTPYFLPENMSVYTAMERLRNENQRYGLVTDEFGSIEGIVTISDILGALVGSVSSGASADIIIREDGSCLIDGQCSFYDFLDHYDMTDRYQEYNYNTLSGLILELLQHIPTEGEKIEWLCFTFEIVDMDGARIDKVLVQKNETDNITL